MDYITLKQRLQKKRMVGRLRHVYNRKISFKRLKWIEINIMRVFFTVRENYQLSIAQKSGESLVLQIFAEGKYRIAGNSSLSLKREPIDSHSARSHFVWK